MSFAPEEFGASFFSLPAFGEGQGGVCFTKRRRM
jgi:hypothetical protein